MSIHVGDLVQPGDTLLYTHENWPSSFVKIVLAVSHDEVVYMHVSLNEGDGSADLRRYPQNRFGSSPGWKLVRP